MVRPKTVGREVSFSGVGVHSGSPAVATVAPAPPNSGLHVVTTRGAVIPVRVESVQRCRRGVTLGVGDDRVGSVEHLLAALGGLGVTNAVIRVDGPEVPVLDGSALPFVEGLNRAGLVEQPGTMPELVVRGPLRVGDHSRWVEVVPSGTLELDVEVSYDSPRVGHQRFAAVLNTDRFTAMVAPARTFAFLTEVPELRSEGFGYGGSLDNCLVLDGGRLLTPPLRFRDEVVRHKVLDLLGDLTLLEYPLRARVVAHKAGHALHVAALGELLARPELWELVEPGRLTPFTVHPYGGEWEVGNTAAG